MRPTFDRQRHCIGLIRWAVVGVVVLAGCADLGGEKHSDTSIDGGSDEASDVIRRVVERGPLRIVSEVRPAAPRLSDEPVFSLSFEFEEGVTVNKPPFGKALGDFEILEFREPPPKFDGARQIEKQIYRLEPTTAGELTIAPIQVTFRDGRPKVGDHQQHALQTEPIVVSVSTMLSGEAPSLSDLHPAVSPVALPEPISYTWLWLLLIPCLLLTAFVWWFRRGSRASVEPIYSPREIAEAALRELDRSGISETDTKRFYVELTGIVRRYLEQTTGVRAPELTTDEFLRDIGDNHAFRDKQREGLQQFLRSADLVKFAGHQPTTDDIQGAIRRARRFIEISWAPDGSPFPNANAAGSEVTA